MSELCGGLAVDAAQGAVLGALEAGLQMALGGGDALRIAAAQSAGRHLRRRGRRLAALGHVQQREDQRHAHELAVQGLAEIARARVIVHGDADFVDARQGVQDREIRLRRAQLFRREDVFKVSIIFNIKGFSSSIIKNNFFSIFSCVFDNISEAT